MSHLLSLSQDKCSPRVTSQVSPDVIHCTIMIPGDRHVSEIASMALDLLAGSVVFQIPHRPNARLNIRMGIHRWESSVALEIYPGIPSQWSGMWGGRRLQDPQLLRDVRHKQRGQGHGEDGGGHEDPHQWGHQGSVVTNRKMCRILIIR